MTNLVKSLQSMNYVSNDFVRNIVDEDDEKKRSFIRKRIYTLEDRLKAAINNDEMNIEMGELTHYFIKGVYARELFIPAGTIMVSKLHKFHRICIISQGDITFTSETGTKRIRAPYAAVFPSGSKVALYTHEDTTWTAIFGTDETNIDIIEDVLTAKDHAEYFEFKRLEQIMKEI